MTTKEIKAAEHYHHFIINNMILTNNFNEYDLNINSTIEWCKRSNIDDMYNGIANKFNYGVTDHLENLLKYIDLIKQRIFELFPICLDCADKLRNNEKCEIIFKLNKKDKLIVDWITTQYLMNYNENQKSECVKWIDAKYSNINYFYWLFISIDKTINYNKLIRLNKLDKIFTE